MSLKCLVFDCDGVLLDSVPVKTNAFARLARPYGQEAEDLFVMYHVRHGGVSRYLKFAWFFREVLGREITEQESRDWGEKFAQYALDEVRNCPMIAGARSVLETWHGILPMYVCSGAPSEELTMVLKERNLETFFSGIYGSPPGKAQLLQNIVSQDKNLLPEEVLMVGDAGTDRDAAEHVGTLFYGIGKEWQGASFPWSIDLTPLNDWIRTHV